jgi:polysaccharide biosynthesis/export protein
MRQQQRHLRTCGTAIEGRLRMERRNLWLTLLVLMVISGGVARGQFSGPAPGPSTVVNPPVTITTDPAILFPGHRDAYLGIEDLISVHIFGSGEYSPTARVALDGTVQLPLIGSVAVDGLTVHQAQDLIAQKLESAGMYRAPQVSIQITESPNLIATVVGEARGVVPIVGERRLYDVLVAAGGMSPTASHIITINRPGLPEPITIDLGTDPAKSSLADIPIFPRDTIIVPRVGVVYLLGAFKTQGAIPLTQNSPMTLMKMAALSGGPGWEGKTSDLRIIRSVGLTRQVVRVDIKRVMNGKDPDPVLQAEDIVFLPTSSMKAAIKSGGIGTVLGIVSLLIVAIQQ